MITPIDVEGICTAKDLLCRELAQAHRERLLQLYRDNSSNSPYQPDVEGMTRRRLRNQCLSLLMALESDPEIIALCFEQAVNGDNMTDVLAALTLLNNIDCPQRQQALDAYFERWKDIPLAIDKWFQVQAQTRMPDALQQIQALMGHPAFDMSRPDRIRALFAWFFGLNFRSFHHPDGRTYHFFTDILLKLDQMNPTAVAWLYRKSDFVRWRLFDKSRQELMKAQMLRILEQEKVSKGLYELVSKCLA
jgi:aminopeptidase N